jgi:acyl-CoA reductase-like NAD-dependent aldehyde dehydrogenase
VARFPAGGVEDVDRAVEAAYKAWASWRRTPAAQRAQLVLRLAAAIEASGDELAFIDTVDNGSPLNVMRGDFQMAADQLRYFAGMALALTGDTIPSNHPDSIDFTLRDPYGVVGRIIPFNHPLMFAASKLGAPLVAGNTIVLKPSQHTSLSALRLGELAADIFPPGVVNVLSGAGSVVGDRLVAHPNVPRIAFTGGTEVGLGIQRRATEGGVKVVTLELGGKNPILVFPDADFDDAVAGALRGMNFTWQGQSCGSTSRLYVHRSIYERFLEALGAAMAAMRVGDPLDEHTDVGPVVSRGQYDKVLSFLREATADARVRVVTGGLPEREGPGFFIRPTLCALDDDDGVRLACEEIFGPVLVAVPFDSYDDVIARANRLPYGLTASVWTNDLSTAMRASRDLETGYIWVNWSSSHIPGTPFGGVKDSGVGREEGLEELLGYTQAKNVYVRFRGGMA